MIIKNIFRLLLVPAIGLPMVPGFQQTTSVPWDGIPGVAAKSETVQLVKEGFNFTEGPVATADGGLYFSDITNSNRTYHMNPKGEITIFREQTGGGNGLAVNKAGELFTVEGESKRVTKFAGGKLTVLTEGSVSKPLMAPNDIFLDAKGGIY